MRISRGNIDTKTQNVIQYDRGDHEFACKKQNEAQKIRDACREMRLNECVVKAYTQAQIYNVFMV